MLDKVIENNRVSIIGEVVSEFEFSHEVFGEGFYLVNVSVNRLSDRHEGVKNKLILSIFVREMQFIEEEEIPEEQARTNQIFLDGYVCKPPVYRKTPLGREIADILVAVNRPYGKSDYIPCIAWGRNARYASTIEVGGHLQIWGRVQSREYTKKISEEQVEKRVAYEVSVSKIDVVEEDEA